MKITKRTIQFLFIVWNILTVIYCFVGFLTVAAIIIQQLVHLPVPLLKILLNEASRMALLFEFGIGCFVSCMVLKNRAKIRKWIIFVLLYCAFIMFTGLLPEIISRLIAFYSPVELLWFFAGCLLSIFKLKMMNNTSELDRGKITLKT